MRLFVITARYELMSTCVVWCRWAGEICCGMICWIFKMLVENQANIFYVISSIELKYSSAWVSSQKIADVRLYRRTSIAWGHWECRHWSSIGYFSPIMDRYLIHTVWEIMSCGVPVPWERDIRLRVYRLGVLIMRILRPKQDMIITFGVTRNDKVDPDGILPLNN